MASFFGSKLVLLSILFANFSLFAFCDDKIDPVVLGEESSDFDSTNGEEFHESVGAVKEEDGVLILTDNNFDSVVNNKSIILVEFYAPWCGHCKSLAPEYAKAAKRLALSDPLISLAKVDATVEEETAKRFGVQGYPTLKLFRDGQPEDYDGPREADGIVNYMKEKGDPNYKPPPNAVITLTAENFDNVTEHEDIILVEFYAPWCGHCKRLEPKLEKAAKELQNEVPPIKVAKVDADQEKDLAKKYDVTGYPTMKIFRKGEASEYKGEKESHSDIVDYMKRQSGDPSQLLKDIKDVNSFLENGDEPVILALMEDENDPLLKLYFAANNDIRDDFKFGHTFNAAVKRKYKVHESCILLIHPEYLRSPNEPKYHIHILKATSPGDISAFYTKHQAPLVGHFQSHTEKRFKKPLVLIFYDVSFEPKLRSMTQFWRNKVLKVARIYKDITFAVADEESFEEKMKDAGRLESDFDVNVVLYDESGRRYALDEDLSEESLTEFIDDFKAGKLKPIVKSQAAPKKQTPVTVVVGNTFDEIVKDPTKEVLIEFYAPWCGHCKNLEPIYKKLAEKYKNHKNLVIAKIDATANEAPLQYAATGFPTIYWAPPGNKDSPVLYSGDRTLEGFEKFLNENSKVLTVKKDEL